MLLGQGGLGAAVKCLQGDVQTYDATHDKSQDLLDLPARHKFVNLLVMLAAWQYGLVCNAVHFLWPAATTAKDKASPQLLEF